MRKAVEKIIEKAYKYNYSDDIIDILKREDLTVSTIEQIHNYYYANKKYYTSEEICGEINKILSFPFKGNSKEYKEKLSKCLPGCMKDTLLGNSLDKRRIFYLKDYKDFNFLYVTFLYNHIDYSIIKKVYTFFKENDNYKDILPVWYLQYRIYNLKNKKNINFLIDVWIECCLLKISNNIVSFSVFADIIKNTDKTIEYTNIDIKKYTTKNNKDCGIYYSFYKDYIFTPNEFVTTIIDKFNIKGHFRTNLYNEYIIDKFPIPIEKYNNRYVDEKIINQYTELANKTNTTLTLDLPSSDFEISVKQNSIFISLVTYYKIDIYKNEFNHNKPIFQYDIVKKSKNTLSLFIPENGYIYIKNTKTNKYYPLPIKQLIKLKEYEYNDEFVRFINLYVDYLISKNPFIKDAINDCKDNCLIPLSVNECIMYHNRAELIKAKYKTANNINIDWNKRNLNLSYLYIKSLPYIDDKGKEILKQIKDIDFNMIKNSRHNYKYKVKDFLSYIIYKNIQDNLVVDKENEITKELSILPDIIDDEKESLARYEENLDETKYLCYDYVNMLMFNTARKNREKIKLNIKSVNEIRNKHDNVTTYTNIDRETHLVKIKKDSVFNELRNILPNNFEWIKTRKRLILETKIQHHCVWSYANKITNDKCAIYSYVDKDGSKSIDGTPKRYTIEFGFNKNTCQYYVIQTQGRYDSVNASDMEKYINAILDDYYKTTTEK